MFKFRHLLMILLLASSPLVLEAQDDRLAVGLRAGHNVAFGNFAAVSLETIQTFLEDFIISGGIQYSTIGKTALEACSAYIMDFDWGCLATEVMMAYTNLMSINSFAVGAGASVDFERVRTTLGYYYRLYGGLGGKITEPFNVYYECCVQLLQKITDWDLQFIITNNELFELERHYQPSFILEGFYYPMHKLGVSLGIGCKPAGMFNISADYYQSYLKAGVCYRW